MPKQPRRRGARRRAANGLEAKIVAGLKRNAARWAQASEVIAANVAAAEAAFAARGLAMPKPKPDEWEHLALVVGIPYSRIEDGSLTPREVHALACAWVDRERLRARIVESAKPPAPVEPLPTLCKAAAVALRLLRLSPNVRQTVTALAKTASDANAQAWRTKRPRPYAVQSGNRILAGLRELKAGGLAEEPNAPKHDGWALTGAGRTFAIHADGLPGSC